jgi:hypothetical protein
MSLFRGSGSDAAGCISPSICERIEIMKGDGIAWGSLLVLAVAILFVGCPGPEQAPVQISVPKIKQAQAMATAQDQRARISVVSGKRNDGQWLTDPEQTELFSFLAVARDLANDRVTCWMIEYRGQWTMAPIATPIGVYLAGDLSEVGMDVSEAWRLVKIKNFNKPFQNWSLDQSIFPGSPEHPYFTFAADHEQIMVDTVTSEITIDRY